MKGYSGSTVFKCNEWKAKLRSFAGSSAVKESACNEGDLSLIPGLERSPGGGHGNPLQYSWASLLAQMVKNPLAMWET